MLREIYLLERPKAAMPMTPPNEHSWAIPRFSRGAVWAYHWSMAGNLSGVLFCSKKRSIPIRNILRRRSYIRPKWLLWASSMVFLPAAQTTAAPTNGAPNSTARRARSVSPTASQIAVPAAPMAPGARHTFRTKPKVSLALSRFINILYHNSWNIITDDMSTIIQLRMLNSRNYCWRLGLVIMLQRPANATEHAAGIPSIAAPVASCVLPASSNRIAPLSATPTPASPILVTALQASCAVKFSFMQLQYHNQSYIQGQHA